MNREGEVLKDLRGATRLRVAGAALIATVAAGVVAASALAVVNGRPDGNAHPYVGVAVSQAGELCSGSLLSSTVFLTAAHCFADNSIVLVDVQESLASDQLATAVPGVVHLPPRSPVGNGLSSSDHDDFAVVTLMFGGLSVDRYASLPTVAGYDDSLPNNQRVDIVGYGVQDPRSNVAGTRLNASAKIVPGGGKTGSEFLKISSSPGQGGATCFGDSGGPDLQAGTDMILAISSYGASGTCSAVDYSQRMDTPEALSFVNGFLHP
jgi:secreted trypsin-like serine protease